MSLRVEGNASFGLNHFRQTIYQAMVSIGGEDNDLALRDHGNIDWRYKNANWAVKQMITGTMFPKFCQFISRETDEMFGSDWQKSVCFGIGKGMTEDALEAYWNGVGMKEARRVLNNKRNNATQSMKRRFKGAHLL